MKQLLAVLLLVIFFAHGLLAESRFDQLLRDKKYQDAIDYAEANVPFSSRNSEFLDKLAEAYNATGETEKALACYMVAWRLNPKDYPSLLGAAKIYNQTGQPDKAVDMARKALEQNFNSEASWEYARACIALNRSSEAKKALEKVIETDRSNVIANRELGIIYFNEGAFARAIPLLRVSYKEKADAEIAFKIGRAYVMTNNPESGIEFLKRSLENAKPSPATNLELAHAFYSLQRFGEAADQFEKVGSQVSMDAMDFYMYAVALEQSENQKDAMGKYILASKKYGEATVKEALISRLKSGRFYLERREFGSALTQLEFVYNADKNASLDKDLFFLLADAYDGLQNTSKTIQILEKAISLDKKNLRAYARLADLYDRNKMSDKAKSTYETMISLDPNNPNVYLILGQFSLEKKEYEKALDFFEKSSMLKETAACMEGIAKASFYLGQTDLAKSSAQRAVTMDGSLVNARIILCRTSLTLKDYNEASRQLEYLLNKEPRNLEYLKQLTQCYSALNQLSDLAKTDQKIIALDRNNVESRRRYADYLLGSEDYKNALSIFVELSALTSKDSEIYKKLYDINLRLGDKNKATQNLERYLSLTSENAYMQRDLGDLYYEQKQYDRALTAYRKALKIDPTIKGFYKRYAEIVIAKGQDAEVVEALNKAIKSNEADAGTYTTLGMIYQKRKNYQTALSMYQKAVQIEPQNVDALLSVGECQAGFGNIREAIVSLEQVVMMNAEASKEYRMLGDLYAQQKKNDKAIKAYMKYLDKTKTADPEVAVKVARFTYGNKQYEETAKYFSLANLPKSAEFYDLLSYGESCYLIKDFPRAIAVLEGLRLRNPSAANHIKILKMLADIYEKQGKLSEMIDVYKVYTTLQGVAEPDISYRLGFLEEKNNPSSAQKIYERNAIQFPKDHRNYYRLYFLYSKDQNMLSKAVPMLKKAASLSDSVKMPWMEVAVICRKLGQTDEELNAYKKCLEIEPQNIEANKRIGSILLSKGSTSEGIMYLEMAKTLDPKDTQVYLLLADGYEKTNRDKEALDLLTKVRNQRKDDPDLTMRLARLYAKSGQTQNAIEEMNKISESKRDVKYLLALADLYIKDGRFKDVESVVSELRLREPENIDALMLLGKAQAAQKKYDDALSTYKEVSTIDQTYAPAYYETAELCMITQKVLMADLYYKRALQRNPKFALAELGLAKLAKAKKNDQEYRQHLENAKKLDPKNEKILEEAANSKE